MANLNLSQFTEKTFVADADWVFVWDTVGAISKKVSRNSLFNSGTLTTSAPVTISQTWDALAVAFTAFKVNATSTNSASGSLLLDLQVGGASLANFNRAGNLIFPSSSAVTPSGPGVGQWVGNLGLFGSGGSLLVTGSGSALNISGNVLLSWNNDTVLLRDGAANTLALRNSTAAQTFNVYGTYTPSPLAYERLTISATGGTSGNAIIGTNKTGTGVLARGLELQTDGVTRLTISTTGEASFTAGISASSSISANAGSYIMWGAGASSRMSAPSNGIIQFTNSATTGFDRLQFGSTTDAYPAIARDGAGIKFTGAAAGLTSHIKVPAVAVASLPGAATAGVGARAFVNDALMPVFGSAVANGGSAKVPVYSDGSAWYVG